VHHKNSGHNLIFREIRQRALSMTLSLRYRNHTSRRQTFLHEPVNCQKLKRCRAASWKRRGGVHDHTPILPVYVRILMCCVPMQTMLKERSNRRKASAHAAVPAQLSLVTVVWLYFTLTHGTSVFFSPLVHHGSSSRLQYSAHSHININHIRLLSHSQHHYFRINHFRIYFLDNKIKKIII
jgi:hypothetical protein